MAAVFAAFYAVCVLAPSAALAFSGPESASHCLNARENARQSAHDHRASAQPASTAHDHAAHHQAAAGQDAPDGAQAQPGGCCGLFCISALAPSFELTAVRAPLASSVEPSVTGFMSGLDPSRIDRPPRTLLSI